MSLTAGDRYDIDTEVGVPAGEGETWAEVADRLQNGDETEVVYVPSAVNCNYYDPAHELVVLDEELKDWPGVHERIRAHELGHAENKGLRGFIQDLILDLQSDLFFRFSVDEEAEQVREYYDQLGADPEEFTATELIFAGLGNLLRNVWLLVLVPLGFIYRRVRRLGGEPA